MARKAEETPGSKRYRSIDDPTAAFPIGALSGIVEELQDEDSELYDDPSGLEGYDDGGGVSPAFLLVALVGGGLVAIGIVTAVAVVVFLM